MTPPLIPVVRCRPGVTMTPAPAGIRILSALDILCKSLARDIEITCGSEDHDLHDPHTLGEAYDISVKGMSVMDILRVKGSLEQLLGGWFTVLYEVPFLTSDPTLDKFAYVNPKATAPHFHIQRAKDTVYPPTTLA